MLLPTWPAKVVYAPWMGRTRVYIEEARRSERRFSTIPAMNVGQHSHVCASSRLPTADLASAGLSARREDLCRTRWDHGIACPFHHPNSSSWPEPKGSFASRLRPAGQVFDDVGVYQGQRTPSLGLCRYRFHVAVQEDGAGGSVPRTATPGH